MRQRRLFASSWIFRGREGVASAIFSPCAGYRYELRRTWRAGRGTLVFVGLNPSTADESVDDPTIRRILGYADDWGLGSLIMLNAFAWRSTDPKALPKLVDRGVDPIGADNDSTIERVFREHASDKLVIGWGRNASLLDRGRAVASMALRFHGRPECFGLTENRQPKHPLYLKSSLVPRLYADLVTPSPRPTP